MLSASCYKGGLAVQLLLCCMHTLAWVVLSCLLGWRGLITHLTCMCLC